MMHRRTDTAGVVVVAALALVCAGCSSYGVRFTLIPVAEEQPHSPDSDAQRVVRVVSAIAQQFGLRPSPDFEQTRDLFRQNEKASWDPLVKLVRTDEPENQPSFLLVTVSQKRQDGAISVMLRNWHQMEESPLSLELREALAARLIAEFGDDRVIVERVYNAPWPFAP